MDVATTTAPCVYLSTYFKFSSEQGMMQADVSHAHTGRFRRLGRYFIDWATAVVDEDDKGASHVERPSTMDGNRCSFQRHAHHYHSTFWTLKLPQQTTTEGADLS